MIRAAGKRNRDSGAVRRRLALASVLAASLVATGVAGADGPVADRGAGSGDAQWTRTLTPRVGPGDLDLPRSASPTRLARAAIADRALGLGLDRDARLRLDRRRAVAGAEDAFDLRFQQVVDGRRLLWSQIDVTVARDRVQLISATVVPVKATKSTGQVRVGAEEALEVALADTGASSALAPLPVAYAGSPTTDRGAPARRARSAWVVEVEQAPAEGEDAATGLCIVVDAESGEVLARWPGLADRPDHGPLARGASADPAAPPAARGDTRLRSMLHVYDGTDGATLDAFKRYATFFVTGDPRVVRYPAWFEGFSAVAERSSGMDAVTANTLNVIRTICVVRGYCGATGGFQDRTDTYAGTVTPWFVIGNTPASSSSASSVDLHVEISALDAYPGTGDPNIPANDIVAHELGHVMHWTYAGDRDATLRQTIEVEEGLADMFAYEYDRFDSAFGEEATRGNRPPPPFRDWANPASRIFAGQPYPAHMRDYDPTPPLNAPHFNSTILSHAYYELVKRIGHGQAGRILHNVAIVLPPQPTFRQVYIAFNDRARAIYGAAAEQAVRDAFQTVGLPHALP